MTLTDDDSLFPEARIAVRAQDDTLCYADATSVRAQVVWLPLPSAVDRVEYVALLTAGVRWALERELAEADERRRARKAAAVEVAHAADWEAVARRVCDRDQAIRSGAFIERRRGEGRVFRTAASTTRTGFPSRTATARTPVGSASPSVTR